MLIIGSIARRVNRYLVVKSAISMVTAGLVWTIFRAAGLELAGAIAMLTFILNFIPSIGSIIFNYDRRFWFWPRPAIRPRRC